VVANLAPLAGVEHLGPSTATLGEAVALLRA
jgi:hypothetical protein